MIPACTPISILDGTRLCVDVQLKPETQALLNNGPPMSDGKGHVYIFSEAGGRAYYIKFGKTTPPPKTRITQCRSMNGKAYVVVKSWCTLNCGLAERAAHSEFKAYRMPKKTSWFGKEENGGSVWFDAGAVGFLGVHHQGRHIITLTNDDHG